MEGCEPIRDLVDSNERGMSGPLTVSVKSPVNPIAQGLVNAAAALGFAAGGDYNGATQEQAALLQSTTKCGSRHSSADAYIWPVLQNRPNLHVVLHAECSKIIIDNESSTGPIATGVQLHLRRGSMNEKQVTVRACKEVIVSSSAVGSPKLLMLSGIGPKNELAKHDIPCIVDLPVGKNLMDHTMTGVIVNAHESPKRDIGTVNRHKAECMPQALRPLTEWLLYGTGHLASSAYDFGMFYKSGLNPNIDFPDIQLGNYTFIEMNRMSFVL
jgi:choline dehydrogenase